MLGFSQTSLTLTADVEGDICPGIDVVYECTTDATSVRWTAEPFFSDFVLFDSSTVNPVDSGNINVRVVSLTPLITALAISNSDMLNSTAVICSAGNGMMKTMGYNRILGKCGVIITH